MVAVSAGDRVVLRTSDGQVALRVLRPGELVGAWRLHVLAPAGRLGKVTGVLEVKEIVISPDASERTMFWCSVSISAAARRVVASVSAPRCS